MDSIKLSVTVPVEPKMVYQAWLNSREHSAFTNSKAEIEKKVGSDFTAGDGYISGTNELLHMNKRIVQTWRTTDFSEENEDSTLEVRLQKVDKGTKVSIIHTGLPDNSGSEYKKGWRDNYLKPMKSYFEEKISNNSEE